MSVLHRARIVWKRARQVYRVDVDSAGLNVRLDLLSPANRCNVMYLG